MVFVQHRGKWVSFYISIKGDDLEGAFAIFFYIHLRNRFDKICQLTDKNYFTLTENYAPGCADKRLRQIYRLSFDVIQTNHTITLRQIKTIQVIFKQSIIRLFHLGSLECNEIIHITVYTKASIVRGFSRAM
jgi:hypothetical protein